MATTPLTPGYRPSPYWWDDVVLPGPVDGSPDPGPPARCDVVVVGGGFTGLAAALELARRGRQVAVVDRDGVCRGASSRNGGMVQTGGMHDVGTFVSSPAGRAMWDDTVAAFQEVAPLADELGVDCDWHRTGHVELAHHPRMARRLQSAARSYGDVGDTARYVDGDELSAEIGSRRFPAGLVVERSGAVHPAKLAVGLAGGAARAGASLHGGWEARTVDRDRHGFRLTLVSAVATAAEVRADDVVVATNGYTTRRPVPWLARRVLAVGSFMIATEPLPAELVASVSPRGRMFFDTKNFVSYWRPSPDGRRILFGGRTSLAPTTVSEARDQLYRAMVAIHPQLSSTAVDRAWGGEVALTADRLPHVGRHPESGVVFAMGYCGTGVALSLHFGRCVGRWLCGDGSLPAFAGRRWAEVPTLARVPWLVPVGGWWYRARDVVAR